MRILRIHSLPNSRHWIDRDKIMLHACFQILTDIVEKECIDTHYNYKAHKEFVGEVRILYGWWAIRKDNESFDDDEKDNEMLDRLIKIRLFLWT